MNRNAALIQEKFMAKVKVLKDARALRQKLKALPYVCRSGFVKMEMLKKDS